MRVLLDHNIPRPLRGYLVDHMVDTASVTLVAIDPPFWRTQTNLQRVENFPMKLAANILTLPLKRILLLPAVAAAAAALYFGLAWGWCLLLAVALVFVPWVVSDSLVRFFLGRLERETMPHYRRASEMVERGEYHRAIHEYDAAIRIAPHNPRARSYRGVLWCGVQEYDQAIADHTAAIDMDMMLWALTEGRTGRFESQAGKHYLGKAYADRGEAFLGKGDPDAAIADCDAAISLYLDPTARKWVAHAHNIRGLAYYARREPQRAIDDFDVAIRLNQLKDFGHEYRRNRERAYIDTQRRTS